MITPNVKHRIKQELSHENPTIWIGKQHLSAQIISEIDKQLDDREMIKIRILTTALKKEEKAKTIASQVAKQTNATLIEVRGHTFMLYRRRKPKKPK
ncbi:MAG: YhbY family RNA-binding protein [Candidatus Bathyarchaeales archaeon]